MFILFNQCSPSQVEVWFRNTQPFQYVYHYITLNSSQFLIYQDAF